MDHATALKEADAIAAVAREHADETEAGHRLAAPVAAAIKGSDLTRWWLPTALGGYAGHPATFVDVIERISAGDASTGWCAGIAIGGNAISAVLPEHAAKEFFSDVSGGCGPFAPTGQLTEDDGQLRIKGRWPFASNCQQASWGCVGFMQFDGGAPVMREGGPLTGLVFLHADQYEIDETWNMAGLRGTGSHDLVGDAPVERDYVTDLFVPKWPDDPLFRLRMFDLLGPSLGVVPLGIGRAALDAADAHIAATGDQPQRGPKLPYGIDPLLQDRYAKAARGLHSAKLYIVDALSEAYEHGERGDAPPRALSARIGLGVHGCLDAAREAVEVAALIQGTAANREGALIDRLRRDLIAASGHVMFSPSFAAPLGRQLAGLHTVVWPFLPPED